MIDTFTGVLAFAFLGALLVVGTLLRARVAVLRRALMPASLIGGLLGFTLLALPLDLGFERADFTAIAFHCFTLSFMSLVLTGGPRDAGAGGVTLGGSWLAVVWVVSLVLQALLGLAIVLGYNTLGDNSLSAFLGLLVTHGFTQGPGQALALGNIWESELGVAGAVDFGLIYASVGFLAAFVVGVPVARRAVRLGLNANQAARLDAEFLQGYYDEKSRLVTGHHVTNSANLDTFAWHIGILGVAYLLTDQYIRALHPIAAQIPLGSANLGHIFSHNLFFIHGLIICLILRRLMDRFGVGRFIDDDTQRRITGSAVDFMVVATLASIQFGLLAKYFAPIAAVCVSVTIGTAVLCFGFGRLVQRLGVERALTSFGCCCGSTGTGLVLLRVLDPDLSTPVARELAFFNIAILFLGFHVLTLMAPVLPSFSLTTIVGVYGLTFVAGMAALVALSRRLNAAA
ncbi:MAG: sodium/glutamate symporter [Pseudomonadota bacterium]